MSSAARISFVLLAVCFSTTSGWGFWDDFIWYSQKPSKCPYEDPDTHVCSTLASANFTCVTIACCEYFDRHDEAKEYLTDDFSDDSDDSVNYNYEYNDGFCRLCYTAKPCTLYKCYRRCCDGYVRDYYHRCTEKSQTIECQNGGTAMKDYFGHWYCDCPRGFYGKSCEIPLCHCMNGGTCDVRYEQPYCRCPSGFTGESCERATCSPACRNGGQCMVDGDRQYCSCPYNYVGKYCEIYFQESPYCPDDKMAVNDTVGEFCFKDGDCSRGHVCCKVGNSTVCRPRTTEYCVYNGKQYRVGETYHSPSYCEICECTKEGNMQCLVRDCAPPSCNNPIKVEGKCCHVCPDVEPDVPLEIDCPSNVVPLYTDPGKPFTTLTQRSVDVDVRNKPNHPYKIDFEPRTLGHCKCQYSCTKEYKVFAIAYDDIGNRASCAFRAVVKDTEPPRIMSCPDDVFIFDDEIPEWSTPEYTDNVGVNKVHTKWEPRALSVGNYKNKILVEDYDRNVAECTFEVVVSSKATPVEQLPQGMKERSAGYRETRLTLILAPTIGGVLLLIIILVLLFCFKRRATKTPRPRQSRGAREARREAYENNIYALPGDIDSAPPIYCELPPNPPPYSEEKSSLKDYKPASPPSYTNAGYASLSSLDGLRSTKIDDGIKPLETLSVKIKQ